MESSSMEQATSNGGPSSEPGTSARIATEADLEKFALLPVGQRQLSEPLRCVLLETALTGMIRYNWSLLRPLVEFLTEKTLLEYESAAMAAEGAGPSRPAFPGEALSTTIERFKTCMGRFGQAPWTIQRLCEVLLAPSNQYSKLHKVALAIEKCLMVTSEVGVSSDLPPPPLLSDLTRPVNCNPPAVNPVKVSAGGGAGAAAQDIHSESSTAFTSSLLGVIGSPPSAAGLGQGPSAHAASAGNGPIAVGAAVGSGPNAHHHHHQHHAGGSHGQGSAGAGITAQEHMEEDHWPDPAGVRPGLAPLHGLTAHHHPHPLHAAGPPPPLAGLVAPQGPVLGGPVGAGHGAGAGEGSQGPAKADQATNGPVAGPPAGGDTMGQAEAPPAGGTNASDMQQDGSVELPSSAMEEPTADGVQGGGTGGGQVPLRPQPMIAVAAEAAGDMDVDVGGAGGAGKGGQDGGEEASEGQPVEAVQGRGLGWRVEESMMRAAWRNRPLFCCTTGWDNALVFLMVPRPLS